MDDERDVFAHDQGQLAEIHLLTELVIAATNSPGRLAQDRIDSILGVVRLPTVDGSNELDDPPGLPRQRDAQDPASAAVTATSHQAHAQS